MDQLNREIIAIIAEVKGIASDEISSESSLASLGVSSLEAITVVHEVEDRWDVTVPDDALGRLGSVNDIVSALRELRGPE